MMDRFARFLPLTLLFLLLAACGGGDVQPFEPAGTAQALLDSQAFTQALAETDQALIYGLDEASITGSAVYTSLSAGAEEIAVFVLSDEDAAAAALSALKQRVEDQTEALRDYQPEEVSKLENAIVEQRGNSVLLVVAADHDAALAIIDSES